MNRGSNGQERSGRGTKEEEKKGREDIDHDRIRATGGID